MAKEIKLPQLGQTMEEGTIVNALIKAGDQVKKGDVLFEIETDKATLEMESPDAGFVKAILIEVGETVPINTTILLLGDESEQVDPAYIDALRRKISGDAAPAASAPAPVAAPAKPAAATVDAGAFASVKAEIVKLPQLGQTMEEGTIVNTLVKIGDAVKKGDVLFEIETDKATLEMESPAAGTVKAILAQNGETLPINTPVLILADAGVELPAGYVEHVRGSAASAAPAPAAEQKPAPAAAAAKPAVSAPAPMAAAPVTAPGERVFATPRAKMIAEELGIDLRHVSPANAIRIVEADVRMAAASGGAKAAAAGMPTAPAPKYGFGQKVPLNRLQKIVAEKMVWSKQNIPCFYLNVRVDATKMVELRSKMNKTATSKLSFNDFIIRAVALGIQHYPIMTGQLAGDHIQLANQIDIGLAISTDEGLVAPICKDCGAKTLAEINSYCMGLINRAKSNKLSLDDLAGGCITISNLGGFGIDSFIPIVVPGQTSILGIGGIIDTVVPRDGNMMVHKIMNMTLSVDHKVVNGAEAAQFLDFVKKLLEHPDGLV